MEEPAFIGEQKKMELEDDIIRQDTEIKTGEKAIKVDKDDILLDDSDIERIREEVISKDKEEEKIKEEKRANRRAIVSLALGVASWIGMITVIMPIVGGIWSIVDGCTALKGKTKYKKCAIWGIVLSVLLYASVFTICIYGFVSSSKWEEQLNAYIGNEQYTEAQAFIEDEYGIGTLSYVEKSAYLFELQGMYDEAVELWVEYCNNKYSPIDIPDSIINELNEYLDKHEANLSPNTIEKIHSLISSKEVAKAEEQAAKEAEERAAKEAEEQAAKEAEEQVAKEAEEQTAKEAFEIEEKTEKEEVEDVQTSVSDETYFEDEWIDQDSTGIMMYENRGFDSIADFTYQNTDKMNKLIKFYNEALEKDISQFVNVEYEIESILKGSMQYKQTMASTEYKYYGKIKNGLPDGQGIIVEYISNYGVYLPKVLGNFKKGQLDGYAINFAAEPIFQIISEGNYKNDERDGECTLYSSKLLDFDLGIDVDVDVIDQYQRYIRERKRNIDNMEPPIFIDVPLTPVYISSKGKLKDGEMTGDWIAYYVNGNTRSKMKMSGKSGKGTLYYLDGTIQYEGEIKDGKYHGKGTLYREDGSIEYKGKFKNGEIDN